MEEKEGRAIIKSVSHWISTVTVYYPVIKYLLRSFLAGKVRFSSTTIMQIWILSYVK